MIFLPGRARLRHFAGCLGLLRFLLPAVLFAPLFGHHAWLPSGGLLGSTGLGALCMPAFVVTGSAMRAPLTVPGHSLAAIWAAGAIIHFPGALGLACFGLRGKSP